MERGRLITTRHPVKQEASCHSWMESSSCFYLQPIAMGSSLLTTVLSERPFWFFYRRKHVIMFHYFSEVGVGIQLNQEFALIKKKCCFKKVLHRLLHPINLTGSIRPLRSSGLLPVMRLQHSVFCASSWWNILSDCISSASLLTFKSRPTTSSRLLCIWLALSFCGCPF